MKLLTLNCHSWQEDNQIEKIKYLAKIIKEKQYDAEMTGEVCYVGLAHYGKRSCIRWRENG